ncbi:bifunctional hydroxymethylpyrimidine kinase/phosphomethylpyrimidine kinase [soil metagenome]
MNVAVPVALTIAGSDCSAGAGAQADLKTFGHFGVYGLTALTCVVAETPGKVQSIQPVETAIVGEQVQLLLESFPIGAIKTGMLYSAAIVAEIARTLREWNPPTGLHIPVVVDPVMVATSGDLLLQRDAIEIYEHELFPMAAVLTPNLDEAATLLGEPIDGVEAMRSAVQRLTEKYGVPVLLKGGHLGGDVALDLLFLDGRVVEFTAPFSHGVHTHGTGCTYAAAIAAGLATKLSLEDAVRQAKTYVTASIAQHFSWNAGEATLHALNHAPRLPHMS